MYWILLSVAIGSLGYYYFHRNFNYFKRHNVVHMPSIPIFGCMIPVMLRRMSFGEFSQKLYTFMPSAKYIGIYATTEPLILLRDPELIKETFVRNFEHFPNRVGFRLIDDPLFSKNLFSLQGQKWRDVRTMLSPAFTSSKMKTMFTLMLECAEDFTAALWDTLADNSDMDMKDAFAKYTTDVIATCAFGIKVNTMKDPTNKFYVYGKDASNFQGLNGLKMFLYALFPGFMRIIGLKFLSDKVETFFKNTIRSTIHTRDTKNIARPDMIQLMMNMRGKREAERELDIEDMTAQAFGFFLGGFETTSTAMSFITQEITANPDVQTKLRQEIDRALENSKGKVTYEVVNRLEYLDAVINEVLRFYPPLIILERSCEKDYELPPALPGEKPFMLKKGMVVWVPIYSLQRDEKYYDEPEKFRPERFLNNNTYHNSPYYAPFGLGPRMCIANRFALLEIKIVLLHLLARCELNPCAKSVFPIKLSKGSAIMLPEGGFWLNVKRRSEMHPTIASATFDNNVNNL